MSLIDPDSFRDFAESYSVRGGSITAGTLVIGSLYVARIFPEKDFVATKLMWANGATINGDVEAGVFTYDGTTWTRVVTTGIVAQAGATAVQTVSGLSIPISRANRPYLWLIPSSATATFDRVVSTAASRNNISPSGLFGGVKASVNQPCPATVTAIVADIRTIWMAVSE